MEAHACNPRDSEDIKFKVRLSNLVRLCLKINLGVWLSGTGLLGSIHNTIPSPTKRYRTAGTVDLIITVRMHEQLGL